MYQWNWDVSGDKATLDNIRGFESLTPSNINIKFFGLKINDNEKYSDETGKKL